MLKAITDHFLLERKNHWIDKQTKGKEIKIEKLESLQLEADERYNFHTWLTKAIKQARPSITSHPSTFTHSDAKTTALKFVGSQLNDGLMRTGNVDIEQDFDVFGNAATDSVVWDTFLFLTTKAPDGMTLFEHFQNESEPSKILIALINIDYYEARTQFSKIFEPPTTYKTSHLLKQVYFPFNNEYHLLSLLTSSTLAYEMKRRIFLARFSEETKQAKEKRKKGEYDSNGFDDYINLTVLGLGGTKPQNVSSLNIKNNGQAYLLDSTPPTLQKRDIRLPTYDFFKNSLWRGQFKDNFDALHKLINLDINNINIREGIIRRIKFIIDQVLEKAFVIRASSIAWSETEHYKQLPLAQRIWLDDVHLEKRENQELWLDTISRSFASWIVHSYEARQKNNGAVTLSTTESSHIRQFVEEAISQDKEFF